MGVVWPSLVALALVAGAFLLGLRSGRKALALLPFVVPVALGVWGLVGRATEERADCYETCGSDWLLLFAIFGVIPAAVLAVIELLGVLAGRARG